MGADLHTVSDLDDAVEYCYAQGWTDGLPVVPPTPDKVARFIAASGRPGDEVIATYPSRQREITVDKVAINAVMAGCLPEYLPVVLAIIECMADDGFGLHPINATTGGSAVGFVVNGPIRRQLGMNFRGNVFGPGNRANSTIGRAVRLAQINVMGSVPGAGNDVDEEVSVAANAAANRSGASRSEATIKARPILDRATLGQPGKYAGYHIVENEEDYPTLRPLHVELGYAPDDSVVTAFAANGHVPMSVHAEHTSQEICDSLSHFLVGTGKLRRAGGWCVLVIPPEVADTFVREGWTKRDIGAAIVAGTTRSVAWVKRNGDSLTGSLMDRRGAPVEPGDDEATAAIAQKPEDVMVVVAGGPAGAFVHALLPYGGGLATKPIRIPK